MNQYFFIRHLQYQFKNSIKELWCDFINFNQVLLGYQINNKEKYETKQTTKEYKLSFLKFSSVFDQQCIDYSHILSNALFFLNSISIVIQAQSFVENKYTHIHTHTHNRRHTQQLQSTIEKCLSGILLLIHSYILSEQKGEK